LVSHLFIAEEMAEVDEACAHARISADTGIPFITDVMDERAKNILNS
jgi:hypothetical protein